VLLAPGLRSDVAARSHHGDGAGGAEPLYADYAVFGPFQWARCISPFELLEKEDPVRLWRDRLLDRFGGLARKSPAYDV
jgi:glutathione S-transferase